MEKTIISIIENAVKEIGVETKVELTPSKTHGDYSTNVALKLAKELKDSPLNIANKIKDHISDSLIEKVEVAGPGFINIFLKGDKYANDVQKILDEGLNFGRGNQGKDINVEYVSANPTGYLHVGHARNAAVGDTLSRILRFAGNKVNEEYWLNDSGVQMNILAEAAYVRYQQHFGKDIKMPEDTYKGEDIIDCAKYLAQDDIFGDKYVGVPLEECKDIFKETAGDYMLKNIKQDLRDLGVEIGMYTSEKHVIKSGATEKALKKLENHIYEQDGAKWLKTTELGDDKDRVLVKADGEYTYFAPDIGGHAYKMSRNHDEIINVFGADHIGYGPRLKIAVELLGLPRDKFDILFIQMVKLMRDGKPLKMSKRAGTSFTIKDLLALVGKDAARYFLVSRANWSSVEFDVEKVKEKTKDNPVFAIQYSHARAVKLLGKGTKELTTNSYQGNEIPLISHLNDFPAMILKIANSHKINFMPKYLLELSRLFNSFYSNSKIIGTEREGDLLSLVKATKIVFEIGLSLIGVSAPDNI